MARLGWPLRVVAAALVLGLVLLGVRTLGGAPEYHVRLRHAAGLKPGDDVRVAGLRVGKVATVTADRDQVDVGFSLDKAPADLGITDDSAVEVKAALDPRPALPRALARQGAGARRRRHDRRRARGGQATRSSGSGWSPRPRWSPWTCSASNGPWTCSRPT
ncbi:MCE family protein [Nocardioides sp. W3-2-3]|uniref:MCE family protein n=1 Tax=Nocardioides convexus TaxID=2712224 RepID=UPI002418BAD4|nr:MCE family protein [Nocardioides convexus]NHA01786.1 MCE family protein [Nocardioides convexus]